ncbi:MAG: NifU family protein [Spirochaetales bacterium]|nr:NifU family protein [Spirochaetales bacterium]
MTFEELDDFTNNSLLPAVSVDGGDIRAVSADGEKLVFSVGGECATCPACNDHYATWIRGKVKRRFKGEYSITLIRKKPYFAEA